MATALKRNTYNKFPSMMIEKELLSEPAKKAFRRSFDITAEALFRLSFNVTITANAEQAKELESVVNSSLDDTMKALVAERKRLKKIIKDNGVTGSVNWPATETVAVNITSPPTGKLLGIITELDGLVSDITTLWLHGILDNRQYTQGLYINQRLVLKMMGRLRQLWYDARKAMNTSDEKLKEVEASASTESIEEVAPLVEETVAKPSKLKVAKKTKEAKA